MKITDGPFYRHDCKNCQYIASTHGNNALSDWYYCPNSVLNDSARFTIVRRDSSAGFNYSSWPKFILAPEYESVINVLGQRAYVENHLMAQAMLAIHLEKQSCASPA